MGCELAGRQIVHQAGDADQEQEKDEHDVEHEQRVECHQLHTFRRTRGPRPKLPLSVVVLMGFLLPFDWWW